MKSTHRLKLLIATVAIICSIALYLFLPEAISEMGRRVIAIFTFAVFFWSFAIIPLYATSLTLIILLTLSLGFPTQFFFIPFSNPVIMLFMGGLLLAKASQKHHLDAFFLEKILKHIKKTSNSVLVGVLLVTAFFSMWISNTAAAAMMLMLIQPIINATDSDDPFRKGLVLAIAIGANLGGIGTPIGSPPNAIAIGILREHGINMDFLTWMMIAVPLAALLLALAIPLLLALFRPKHKEIAYTISEKTTLTPKGIGVLIIAGLVILLWLTKPLHGLSEAIVALIGAALLTGLRFLSIKDFREIQWDVLVLIWGGLALGEAVQQSGLITAEILSQQGILLIILMSILAVLLTAFISNTATANLLLPFAMSISPAHTSLFSITVALACSFSFAFPISTPPNALVYGTGFVSRKDMFKVGVLLAPLALGITLLGFEYVIPWVLSL